MSFSLTLYTHVLSRPMTAMMKSPELVRSVGSAIAVTAEPCAGGRKSFGKSDLAKPLTPPQRGWAHLGRQTWWAFFCRNNQGV